MHDHHVRFAPSLALFERFAVVSVSYEGYVGRSMLVRRQRAFGAIAGLGETKSGFERTANIRRSEEVALQHYHMFRGALVSPGMAVAGLFGQKRFVSRIVGNGSSLMSKDEREHQDPQSEGTGQQKNAERVRSAGGDPDPKEAAREASQGDEKSS
jgi:hypothetical protein